MKRAEILSRSAKKFPSVFREIVTLSIRGFLPPIHKHWWFRAEASSLFGDAGFPMRYSPCRLHIPPELHSVYLGYLDMWDHERLISRVFTKTLRRGDVVIDVGANIGYFTLIAASIVGPEGRVHSVECSHETLALLRNNVRRNNLQNVEIHPFAASSARRTLELNVTAIGLSWVKPGPQWPAVKGSGTTVSVPAMPLDEIISSPIHLVKIDAEGADLDVLKGMKRILSENDRVSAVVEWAPPLLAEAGQDPFELPRWLQQAGFRNILVLDEQRNRQRSLEECIEMVRAGKFPHAWVANLFAQKAPS